MFAIRQFEAQDWLIYKAIRLEALARHEDLYGGSFAVESAWRDSQWEFMLGQSNKAFFGLYDGAELVGSACVFTDRGDKKGRTALLAGAYIREAYRGRKLSRLLYAARIQWIIESGKFDCITVGHKDSNEASRRANQAFGFEYLGSQDKIWGKGSKDIQMYEMRIAI